ncbi:ECU11_0935 [Encephalitozoon cuniculi GB-M1]|uniref:ECU11_0935 protein n=1 Tax=Encephalitozoon cuniculi (strain GB-M1) TaxID=284813 RepID=I7L8N0_ENCCU|nr:uncharacterized protein ECU11_0935 [Encephalitozoon cuniculi GB-M1]UYI26297.1 hypothetical protein J0A71_01g01150 [Encephalitozoon cuniculi]CCI73997.1 ECU11_0935 [Encephalitozoon cuniculi GB-M1]
MDRKFMSSGVFQFLDEVYEQRGPLFDYGTLVGSGELAFDEALVSDGASLRSVLKKAGKTKRSRDGLMDW